MITAFADLLDPGRAKHRGLLCPVHAEALGTSTGEKYETPLASGNPSSSSREVASRPWTRDDAQHFPERRMSIGGSAGDTSLVCRRSCQTERVRGEEHVRRISRSVTYYSWLV